MNLLSWNCRGMGSLRAICILRDLIKSQNPYFVFLSETLVEVKDMIEIADTLGFENSYTVNRVGRGGGLAILWERTVDCQVIESTNNYINVQVMENSNVAWRLTCYYGLTERSRRQEAWSMLRKLARKRQYSVVYLWGFQ